MLPRNYTGIDILMHSLLKVGITAFPSVQEISSVCDFHLIAVDEGRDPDSFALNLTKPVIIIALLTYPCNHLNNNMMHTGFL